jgi:hypothetical protein
LRKPNYRFERTDRDRLKQARKEEKAKRQQKERASDQKSDEAGRHAPSAVRDKDLTFPEGLAHGGYFYLVAERESANWVRNIQSQPQVKVRIGDAEFRRCNEELSSRRAWPHIPGRGAAQPRCDRYLREADLAGRGSLGALVGPAAQRR